MAKSTKKQQSVSESSAPVVSAKQREKERAQLLKKQKQRRKMTNIAIGVGLFAIVAVAMIFFANQPAEAPIPDSIERYAQLPQLRTENNFYRLGNPAAPVQVVEYASYTCPACLNFYETGMERVVDLVREGVISYTFIPRFVGAYQNAEGAARAAFCAGEQGKYFEMHDALFTWQTQYGNTAFTQNRLVSGADELGLNVGDFRSCLTSGRANSHISNADQEANSRGFIGAPITTVNGTQVTTNINEVVSYVYTMQGNQPARPPVIVDETLPSSTSETEVEPTTEATVEVEATEETVEEEVAVEETAEPAETVTEEATPTEEASEDSE